MKECNKS